MKKTHWKGICIGSILMTVLVLARCVATAVREMYYGRDQWMHLILQDFWFYVGAAAAVVGIISAVMWIVMRRKR